ncbi:phage baseplate assembly protein V [Streptomyces sodiiphilus]|uniref:Phage baseplate assembly protein V n=1 Tax=Streptomyces sodiiphilus TaxID=226217 RepID=A0ABP5ARR2_9ACTN
MADPKRYLGKFRGKVTDNADPMGIGRLRVQVPDVLGDTPSSWAMPCFPIAGNGMGQYMVPPRQAGVWVEFEQGNPSYPIWSGCWYGEREEVPEDARDNLPDSPNVVLQTPEKRKVVLSDEPGGKGITLSVPSGASLVIDHTGIHLDNGQGASVSLTGSVVSINQGVLRIERE